MANTFRMTRVVVDEFYLFHVTASAVGDYRILSTTENVARADTANAVLIIKGGCSYTSSDSKVPVITVMAGETTDHLPDFKVGETFRVEALTADTEFFCINQFNHRPFNYGKFSIRAGETYTVPTGSLALLGAGATNKGVAPFICHAEAHDITIVAETDSFGLLVTKI